MSQYHVKMKKAEDWVNQKVFTKAKALKQLTECKNHVRTCNYEISQIEIRKRAWLRRQRLILAGWKIVGDGIYSF